MRKTPTHPGPVAYVALGLLIAVAFAPLLIRVVAYDTRLGRTVNLALFGAVCVLFCAAGAYGAALIVRFFRAARAEDRADREAEAARLQAEIDRQRAEVGHLHQRMEEIEDQAWWSDPETGESAEDTVELGPTVIPFRRRGGRWPESQSS